MVGNLFGISSFMLSPSVLLGSAEGDRFMFFQPFKEFLFYLTRVWLKIFVPCPCVSDYSICIGFAKFITCIAQSCVGILIQFVNAVITFPWYIGIWPTHSYHLAPCFSGRHGAWWSQALFYQLANQISKLLFFRKFRRLNIYWISRIASRRKI